MIEVPELVLPSASASVNSEAVQMHRGAPKAIQLLLPIWGTRFIAQFLEVSLPTLLAPGNIPSVAKSLPCKFIFLTSSEDADLLRGHPAIQYLRDNCEVEFSTIDDLITGDNYSTTITLAYARAVRATGDAMLDTCFFFLISDYIMADGSLASVLARMHSGYSGVVAGNFQVVEETARSSFFKVFDNGAARIIIRARDLMRWAINHLHPMTLANMVNFPLCHSIHTNRLFWRVDENTLIGRFYLMHMICIRPEIKDFIIGSSCDYSFIPEMCPSGKVHVLVDSDEYLVVEMQKHSHERNFVRLGAVKQNVLVKSLSDWATATHRKNAHFPVIFHASVLPSNLDSLIAKSKSYIETIEDSLPPPPPHRDHPYWLGAMAAREWAVAQMKSNRRLSPDKEILESGLTGFNWWLYRCRNFIFGRPPQVRPWHPRWPDYRMFLDLAGRQFSSAAGPLLIVSSMPMAFGNFLSSISQSVVPFELHRFRNLSRVQYEPLIEKFEGCVLVLDETQISRAQVLISKIKPLLINDSAIMIFAVNGYGAAVGAWFSDDMLREIEQFFDYDLSIEEIHYVPAGLVPWITLRGMRNAFSLIQKSWLWISIQSIVVSFLMIFSLIFNFGRRSAAEPPVNQNCSSIGLAMRKTGTAFLDPDSFEADPLEPAAKRFSKALAPLFSTDQIERSRRG
jgi:hypothetical protein